MRALLNTLYIVSEDAFLSLDGENVVVKYLSTDETKQRPIHNYENIVTFSYRGATPALMGKCAENNIGLTFFSPRGKFLARVSGKKYGNVLLRKEQYRISDNEERSCLYARNMIVGKVYNSRWVLERTCRDHAQRVEIEPLKKISAELQSKISNIRTTTDLDILRGLEGESATRYFSVFDHLIINQKKDFQFRTRNRRPPLDNVNALLSFGYTLLANGCANALESVGLDSYVGFMHRDRPGRQSLALDMMEELRPIMVDRFVLTLINQRKIKEEDFQIQEDGAVLLNDKGRKKFISEWDGKHKEEIKHPFLDEKIKWGLVPYVQALLLARTIRGDLKEYPPFLWK